MALDTLSYAKKLQQAGVSEQQAEAHAAALWEAIEATLATKQDLTVMRQALEQEIQLVRQDLALTRQSLDQEIQLVRQEMREMETRLIGRIDAQGAHLEGRIDAQGARLDGRINALEAKFEGKFRLLYWMLGFNLALTAALFIKLFAG
jgi:hypothetical protein